MQGERKAKSTLKKTVQFGAKIRCKIHEIESFRDIHGIWWTKDEISEIERESEAIIYFMNSASGVRNPAHADLDVHSIRGLEKKTELGAWEMYEAQRDARNAVLCLQDKHRKFCRQPVAPIGARSSSLDSGMQHVFDAQLAIAKVYQAASLKARRAAYEAGLRDYLETKREGDKALNSPNSLDVPARKSSKVIPITSEPMVPKWGRKISMPLMDPSENSESSSKSTIPKEVEPVEKAKAGRTGAAPKIRSSLSPLKKRRSKPDLHLLSDRARTTPIETSKPKRSTSLHRKESSSESKPTRSASLHKKVSSSKDAADSKSTSNRNTSRGNVSKEVSDKPLRGRAKSPRRKVISIPQVESTSGTPTSSKSQTRKKVSSTLSGDIMKLQKALADFENSSISCDENESLKSAIGCREERQRSTRRAAKKIMEKLEINNDCVGENHRIRIVAKKKQHASSKLESSFRNSPVRSMSDDSKGNQTADTAGLHDLSNSSIESVGFNYMKSTELQSVPLNSNTSIGNHLNSPPPASDSGTILLSLLKRMGGDRKTNMINKTHCVETYVPT